MNKFKVFIKTFSLMFLLAGSIAFVLAIPFVVFGSFSIQWATGVAVGMGFGNGFIRGLFEAWNA